MVLEKIIDAYQLRQDSKEGIWDMRELFEQRNYLGPLLTLRKQIDPLPIGTIRELVNKSDILDKSNIVNKSDDEIRADYHKLERSLNAFGKGKMAAAYALLGYRGSLF